MMDEKMIDESLLGLGFVILGFLAIPILVILLWYRDVKARAKEILEPRATERKKAAFERKAEKLAKKAIEDAALQARAREILEAKLAEEGEDEK